MFGKDTSAAPAPPPLPDPLPTPPTLASGAGAKPVGNTNKIPNYGGTLLTSGQGVESSAPVAKKSLLGL